MVPRPVGPGERTQRLLLNAGRLRSRERERGAVLSQLKGIAPQDAVRVVEPPGGCFRAGADQRGEARREYQRLRLRHTGIFGGDRHAAAHLPQRGRGIPYLLHASGTLPAPRQDEGDVALAVTVLLGCWADEPLYRPLLLGLRDNEELATYLSHRVLNSSSPSIKASYSRLLASSGRMPVSVRS